MFDAVSRLFRGPGKALACSVITPVGPGHEGLSLECKDSVEKAWQSSHGPFSDMRHIAIDDTKGKYGRSRARNIGIQRAAEQGADWLFFLDADDLLAPGAFEGVQQYAADYDAVWGLIVGQSPDAGEPHLRIPQILTLNSFDELILFDPFLTLQIGHFVRTNVALKVQFNEFMNTGEDVDYYLRLWKDYRCSKVQETFFINRHSRRSTGPKAATAEQWGKVVRGRLLEERGRHALLAPSARLLGMKNARVAELQSFCRQHRFAGDHDYLSLSRQMPYRGYVDVTDYEGENFVLYTNNDDRACASLAWKGEYYPLSCGLWQALSKSAQTIFDIGADHGFFGLLAARVATAASIHCFEPAPGNFARMRLNIDLNGCANMQVVNAAISDVEGMIPAVSAADVTLSPTGNPFVQSVYALQIDAYAQRNRIERIDLARVGIAGGGLAAIQGMRQMIAKCHPDLLIVISDDHDPAQLSTWLKVYGYRFYAIHDSRQELEATGNLLAGRNAGDLNRLASTRDSGEIARMANAIFCKALNFG